MVGRRAGAASVSALELGGSVKARPIPVWVHSNLDEVELFLNGKSLGSTEGEADWRTWSGR